MTATAFVEGIKSLKMLSQPQVEQLVSLAPHLTDKERVQTLAEMKAADTGIAADTKEIARIDEMAANKAKEIYKKEWPKVKNAIQEQERASATSKLDEQFDAA